MTRDHLYPHIEPYRSGQIQLDDIHSMYWEQSGNPDGIPVVFLHGGPGAGTIPAHRRFFDPEKYCIVVFDQRGAGRSTPLGELRDNTTSHLIADMETLRIELGINKWLLFGGSWGSTLAIAYGEAHPENCLGLVLRGIFLGREQELDWFLYGCSTVFPEAWGRLVDPLSDSERKDVLGAYHHVLTEGTVEEKLRAARAWSRYEGSCSTLMPSPETVAAFGQDNMALGLARIETHYFVNELFMAKNALLDNIDRIREIPGIIIQGRYDMVCPIVTADELHQCWPEAEYHVIPDAGHSAMDPGVRRALVRATERFKARL
jgi:proline iminopeptidase